MAFSLAVGRVCFQLTSGGWGGSRILQDPPGSSRILQDPPRSEEITLGAAGHFARNPRAVPPSGNHRLSASPSPTRILPMIQDPNHTPMWYNQFQKPHITSPLGSKLGMVYEIAMNPHESIWNLFENLWRSVIQSHFARRLGRCAQCADDLADLIHMILTWLVSPRFPAAWHVAYGVAMSLCPATSHDLPFFHLGSIWWYKCHKS